MLSYLLCTSGPCKAREGYTRSICAMVLAAFVPGVAIRRGSFFTMQPEKVVNRTLNLFEDTAQCQSRLEELCRGAIVLRAFALTDEAPVLAALGDVIAEAPPRHM